MFAGSRLVRRVKLNTLLTATSESIIIISQSIQWFMCGLERAEAALLLGFKWVCECVCVLPRLKENITYRYHAHITYSYRGRISFTFLFNSHKIQNHAVSRYLVAI